MAIITIERDISLDDIDTCYARLGKFREVDGRVEILIPVRQGNV